MKDQLDRLEKKLDLIIACFGLGENNKLSPCEVENMAHNIVLQFVRKNANVSHERQEG